MLTSGAGKDAYVGSFPTREKGEEREKIKRGKYEGLSRKATRRKLAIEADQAENTGGSTQAAIRAAKKGALPRKITEPMARPEGKRRDKKAKTKAGRVTGKKGSAFDDDRGKKHEGMRAKAVKVNLNKKGKGGKGKGRK